MQDNGNWFGPARRTAASSLPSKTGPAAGHGYLGWFAASRLSLLEKSCTIRTKRALTYPSLGLRPPSARAELLQFQREDKVVPRAPIARASGCSEALSAAATIDRS